jgi:Tfp pilus assembly protein PilF
VVKLSLFRGVSLAKAQMAAGDFDGARGALELVLKQRPNAGMALYGIARSYELEGDRTNARRAYKAFLKAWPDADSYLTPVTEARNWLKAH